jgi:hypothetical protein
MSEGAPQAMNDQVLISLAILRANWDDDRKSYIDNFLPFVAAVMQTDAMESYSTADLQRGIKERFGIDMPQAALSTVLTRAVRTGLGRQHDHRFYPRTDRLAAYDLRPLSGRLGRQQQALLDRFRKFAEETGFDLDDAGAATALATYIDEHSIALLRSGLRGEPLDPELPLTPSIEYLVATFIVHAYRQDPDSFDYIDTLVKGSMLSAVLYLPRIAEATARFRNTSLFLDTPVLLTALGYNGPEGRAATAEALALAYRQGAVLAAFDVTVTEMRGVIRGAGAARSSRRTRPAPPSRVEAYFINAGYTEADVELALESLEDDLAALHIRVLATPPRLPRLTVDEPELEKTLDEQIHYMNPAARRHDLNGLVAVHMLRKGEPQQRLETCHAILVTSNALVVKAAAQFFGGDDFAGSTPLAILDDEIGTLVWLKDPLRAPELPRLQILADSYAALEPGAKLWQKYLDEIERLEADGSVSEKQVFTLRYSLSAKQMLMSTSGANADHVSASLVKGVLASAESEVRAPLERELSDARQRAGEQVAELQERVAVAERNEAAVRHRLRVVLDRRRMRARRIATRISLVTAVAAYLLLAGLVLAALAVSLPEGITHVRPDAIGWPSWILRVAAVLGVVLIGIHILVERSPLALARNLRVWVEDTVLGWMTSGTDRDEIDPPETVN